MHRNSKVKRHPYITPLPNAIFRSRLPQSTACILAYLATHTAERPPTYRLIRKDTGISSRAVARALRNLQKLGVVEVTEDHARRGEIRGNYYVLHWKKMAQLTPEYVEEILGESVRHASHRKRTQENRKNEAGK